MLVIDCNRVSFHIVNESQNNRESGSEHGNVINIMIAKKRFFMAFTRLEDLGNGRYLRMV